nr:N-acetylmuramoyl-L-alanine amidase [Ardenticatena sp.]
MSYDQFEPIPRRRQRRRLRSGLRREVLETIAHGFLALSLAVNVLVLVFFFWMWSGTSSSASPPQTPLVVVTAWTPTPVRTPTPLLTATPAPTPTPHVPRIGIIAGHWQNDSGAICAETGLQEVDITLAVSRKVVERLRRAGYDVDLLAEFDPRLNGYQADALVSVHVDSCVTFEGATGFKVARAATSVIPDAEDRLVACLYDAYERATGLPRHPGSITYNMTGYHAFYRIHPQTPAAIIELGFLYHDREMLVNEQDRLARGLVEGITCFLDGS